MESMDDNTQPDSLIDAALADLATVQQKIAEALTTLYDTGRPLTLHEEKYRLELERILDTLRQARDDYQSPAE